MNPPKCPICGKAEWNHKCAGLALDGADSDRVISGARIGKGMLPGRVEPTAGASPAPAACKPSGKAREVKRGADPAPIAHKPEIAAGSESQGSPAADQSSGLGIGVVPQPSKLTRTGSSPAARSILSDEEKRARGAALADARAAETEAASHAKFDRDAYQREYMRDVRAAKKRGMTVAAYRAAKKGKTP